MLPAFTPKTFKTALKSLKATGDRLQDKIQQMVNYGVQQWEEKNATPLTQLVEAVGSIKGINVKKLKGHIESRTNLKFISTKKEQGFKKIKASEHKAEKDYELPWFLFEFPKKETAPLDPMQMIESVIKKLENENNSVTNVALANRVMELLTQDLDLLDKEYHEGAFTTATSELDEELKAELKLVG